VVDRLMVASVISSFVFMPDVLAVMTWGKDMSTL